MPAITRYYKRYFDKLGRTWLVGVGPDFANHIWVESEAGDRGCYGSARRFYLDDGTFITLIGPWCSCQKLFEQETGVKL